MLLFWRIRYLDTRDKTFKDRDLWLDTDTLAPAMKAAVELAQVIGSKGAGREMLKYRPLFKESALSPAEIQEWTIKCGSFSGVCVTEYFEDEKGDGLNRNQLAVALSGNPGAISIPPGAKQHDIKLILSDRRPIPLDQVLLSQDQLETLGYFARDLAELRTSAFFIDGPATLTISAPRGWEVSTAVTDEEIRSFVTIFRRLYTENEPANFAAAMKVFCDVATGYPLAEWVHDGTADYMKDLDGSPDVRCVQSIIPTFSRKRLIDVFLYTQYAHQPDARRTRQYHECLAEMNGNAPLLKWLFLTEMWERAICMSNSGGVVVDFYTQYCRYRNVSAKVLPSFSSERPGIGGLEKKDARQRRIRQEKVQELAEILWKKHGCPQCGIAGFLEPADADLAAAVNSEAAGS